MIITITQTMTIDTLKLVRDLKTILKERYPVLNINDDHLIVQILQEMTKDMNTLLQYKNR